jgi:capsule polysaccharide modification protein KpsS
VLNLSRKNNIECFNIEIARPGGFLDTFKNALPHNIKTKVNLINKAWNNSSHSKEERERIGRSFFEKRFKGLKTNDKVYIKDQVRDKLPKGVDYNKRTFVIFTSSDDEFAAVGKDFENPFFEDQNQGIAYVAKLFSSQFPNHNLIIRMHPNLKGVNYEYVQELRKMDQISPNIQVIAPESDIDSYALLKVAEKVIVFGSTIGLEANYWGKPVVLLGKCFWYYEDIAYIPENKGQIAHLLDKKLEPKNRANAIKFGYYFLEGGERTSYYDEDVNEKKDYYKGKELYNFNMWELLKAKVIQRAKKEFGVRLFVN